MKDVITGQDRFALTATTGFAFAYAPGIARGFPLGSCPTLGLRLGLAFLPVGLHGSGFGLLLAVRGPGTLSCRP